MAGQSLQEASVVVRLPKSLSLAFAGGKTAFPAQDANGAEEGLVWHAIFLCCTTTFLWPQRFFPKKFAVDPRLRVFIFLPPIPLEHEQVCEEGPAELCCKKMLNCVSDATSSMCFFFLSNRFRSTHVSLKYTSSSVLAPYMYVCMLCI
jgi:hypothetical protein